MAVLKKLKSGSQNLLKYRQRAALAAIFSLGLGFVIGSYGSDLYQSMNFSDNVNRSVVSHWQQELELKQAEISTMKALANEEINAMSVKMAQMQAALIKMEAVAERAIDVAGLDKEEFDFGQPLAIGGFDAKSADFERPRFEDALAALDEEIEKKQIRLETLTDMLYAKEWHDEVRLAGKPVRKGFLSSRFGFRANPFNGGLDYHAGVDFAAVIGTPIYSTGAGIISFSGNKGGYGKVIEITHMDGKVTRYAHCNKLLVETGEVVQQGDIIAEVGSTGNSTGPHLHYEVLVGGKAVDPSPYLIELSRKSS